MLTTGIRKFDEVTGGIPENSVNMLLGPANIGKLEFCCEFVWDGLNLGQPALIILTRDTPKRIVSRFESMNFEIENYTKKRMIRMIDCYSKFVGLRSSPSYVTKISGPSDLTTLSFQIFNVLKEHQKFQKPIRCVFHALSTLFLYNTPDQMMRFFTYLIGMIKTMNATLIFNIERIIGEEMAHRISELVDGIIEFKAEGGMFLINPTRLGKKLFPQWIQYKLTDKGLKLI